MPAVWLGPIIQIVIYTGSQETILLRRGNFKSDYVHYTLHTVEPKARNRSHRDQAVYIRDAGNRVLQIGRDYAN